jgi:putative addiction module CopG family antidote
MNLNVSEKWKPFIRSKLRSGQYRSEDEVFDAALRLLKQRDSERAEEQTRIESLLIARLNSGPSTPMTSDDWDKFEREGQMIIATRKPRKAR